MPLQLADELRFPMGATTPLSDNTVNDFMVLLGRISGPISRHQIVEVFKQYFCKASGSYGNPPKLKTPNK